MTIDARIYYPTERSLGILCEVVGGFVYEIGSETWRPISLYDGGRFVKLIEVKEAASEPIAPVDKTC